MKLTKFKKLKFKSYKPGKHEIPNLNNTKKIITGIIPKIFEFNNKAVKKLKRNVFLKLLESRKLYIELR